jgi:outer membrane lipoprotein-sorting protein
MKRLRIIIPIVVVVVLAAVLAAVLTTAPARGAVTLTTLTPTQLISKMIAELPNVKAVHGDFAWTNQLLGSASLPAQAPAELQKLFPAGSGTLWYQDGKVRVQAGNGTDTVMAVENGGALWLFSSLANTATEVTLPQHPGEAMSSRAMPAVPPLVVQLYLNQLSSTATLAVSQDNVASRDAYLLTLTPTTTATTFGSATLAVDAQTFVPLRVQIFARGTADPVFSAGFTSVSYDPVDAGEFVFKPPASATVKRETLPAKDQASHERWAPGGMRQMMRELTVRQARTAAGFPVLALGRAIAPLKFQGAYVVPVKGHGKVAALRYGSGFGTVILAQGRLTATEQRQLRNHLASLSLARRAAVGGAKAYLISTPLLNVMVWQTGAVTHVAGGAVPLAELQRFVRTLR